MIMIIMITGMIILVISGGQSRPVIHDQVKFHLDMPHSLLGTDWDSVRPGRLAPAGRFDLRLSWNLATQVVTLAVPGPGPDRGRAGSGHHGYHHDLGRPQAGQARARADHEGHGGPGPRPARPPPGQLGTPARARRHSLDLRAWPAGDWRSDVLFLRGSARSRRLSARSLGRSAGAGGLYRRDSRCNGCPLQPQRGHRRIAEHSAMSISTAASGPGRARGPSSDRDAPGGGSGPGLSAARRGCLSTAGTCGQARARPGPWPGRNTR